MPSLRDSGPFLIRGPRTRVRGYDTAPLRGMFEGEWSTSVVGHERVFPARKGAGGYGYNGRQQIVRGIDGGGLASSANAHLMINIYNFRRGERLKTIKNWSKAVAFIAIIGCIGCGKRDLRGSYESSRDGKTYLAVIDDNGGHCGPIKVDGKVWSHPIGESGLIGPGEHSIACGGEIKFEIPKGVVYKFDYWGP